MIKIPKKVLNSILQEAKKAYPNECCGLLIGKNKDGQKNVVHINPITNINKTRMQDRYEMDPRELEAADKVARQKSRDIIGIYHSHPDHPPRPSAFDQERAWPVYSYMIVAVEKGVKFEAQSWVLKDWGGEFQEEVLTISGG
jgi:proteasome lid subunit RPN8/RPN11